jgi:hypothetical protein
MNYCPYQCYLFIFGTLLSSQMKKIIYLLAVACSVLPSMSIAQTLHCNTDEHHRLMVENNPDIIKIDKDFNERLLKAINKLDRPAELGRTTGALPDTIDIPIVVHVVHDFGSFNSYVGMTDIAYVSDDAIFEAFKSWNTVFMKQNGDTVDVIQPFKKYIGNPKIRLRLATIDPYGRPTKGITRTRSYLTYFASDEAKYDVWPPSSYVNIWVISRMRPFDKGSAAAYALNPAGGAASPYYDGVISLADYINRDNTMNHEIGHVFSLIHPWGGTNQAQCGKCDDDPNNDLVDDTPPTIGHFPDNCQYSRYTSNPGVCAATVFPQGNMYDTICATNYYRVYPSLSGRVDSFVDYPDTTNAQNIMDYTYCSKMFTKGQVARMRAALADSLANRNNLYTPLNLSLTGALVPRLDLKPIPEYAVTTANNRMQYFTCPGGTLRFWNRSWNDTVTKLVMTFSNTSNGVDSFTNPSYSSFVSKGFNRSGWVTITARARGNNTGDSTISRSDVYVADSVGKPVTNYFQDFAPGSDADKWPSFNYYNNFTKWEVANAGFYDGYSIKYNGYDTRTFAYTGTLTGDFDDIYSIPFDLTSLSSGACNLNFFSSGASRSSNSNDVNDTLEISYSIDRGNTWARLTIISKGDLCNKGAFFSSYTPSTMSDWRAQSFNIPTAARTSYTVFRFRYFPGVKKYIPMRFYYPYSTGNNFYMDRIHFSQFPAELSGLSKGDGNVVIAPNPTNRNAYVVIYNAANTTAKITVTDVTGKTVYTATEQITGSEARIEIPASAISVKGMYMVQTASGGEITTNKLVVY